MDDQRPKCKQLGKTVRFGIRSVRWLQHSLFKYVYRFPPPISCGFLKEKTRSHGENSAHDFFRLIINQVMIAQQKTTFCVETWMVKNLEIYVEFVVMNPTHDVDPFCWRRVHIRTWSSSAPLSPRSQTLPWRRPEARGGWRVLIEPWTSPLPSLPRPTPALGKSACHSIVDLTLVSSSYPPGDCTFLSLCERWGLIYISDIQVRRRRWWRSGMHQMGERGMQHMEEQHGRARCQRWDHENEEPYRLIYGHHIGEIWRRCIFPGERKRLLNCRGKPPLKL